MEPSALARRLTGLCTDLGWTSGFFGSDASQFYASGVLPMSSGDSFVRSHPLLAAEFVASTTWKAAKELSWTAERVGAVAAMLSSLIGEGLRATIETEIARQLSVGPDALGLDISTRVLRWRMHPLEVLIGIQIKVTATSLTEQKVTVDAEAQNSLGQLLQSRLSHLNQRAGAAVTAVVDGLKHVAGSVTSVHGPSSQGSRDSLQVADIQEVRNERVPVEFTMLFDLIVRADQQLMALADILAVAKTMALDDEMVLGGINYYIDKQYLGYDRVHQVIRLTQHGRAASTNAPRGG